MKSYIITLMSAALCVTVSTLILPEGNVKKYAKLICSVLVSLTVALPFRALKIDFEEIDFLKNNEYMMSREEAERIYSDNLRENIKRTTEEELGFLGRVYVTVAEDVNISKIEIYSDERISDETKDAIQRNYCPERLELNYGDTQEIYGENEE